MRVLCKSFDSELGGCCVRILGGVSGVLYKGYKSGR